MVGFRAKGPTIIQWDDKHVVVNMKQAVKQKFVWHAMRGGGLGEKQPYKFRDGLTPG